MTAITCPYCGAVQSKDMDFSTGKSLVNLDVDETLIDLDDDRVVLGCSVDCEACDQQIMVTIDCEVQTTSIQTFDDWRDDQ